MDCLRKKCKTVTYKCKCESVYLCNDHIVEHLSVSKSHKIVHIDGQELIGSFEEVCKLISSQQTEILRQADLLVEYTVNISLSLVKELEDAKRKYLDVVSQLKECGFNQEHLESLRRGYKETQKPNPLKQYFKSDQIAFLFDSVKTGTTIPLKSESKEDQKEVIRERKKETNKEIRPRADREQETARFERMPMEPRPWRKDKLAGIFRGSSFAVPPKRFVNYRKEEYEESKSLIQRPEERKISKSPSSNFRANPPEPTKAELQRPGFQRGRFQRPQESKFRGFGFITKEPEFGYDFLDPDPIKTIPVFSHPFDDICDHCKLNSDTTCGLECTHTCCQDCFRKWNHQCPFCSLEILCFVCSQPADEKLSDCNHFVCKDCHTNSRHLSNKKNCLCCMESKGGQVNKNVNDWGIEKFKKWRKTLKFHKGTYCPSCLGIQVFEKTKGNSVRCKLGCNTSFYLDS